MSQDLDKSLVAHSQFVPFKQEPQMQQSLVAVSEKVYFNNASKINREELEKGKKFMKTIGEQGEEQSQNQFLEVGKWKKAKESTMSKELATVKKQVDEIITQTRWQKKVEQQPPKQEVIADESIVPDIDQLDKDEEIEDQTKQEDDQQEGEEEKPAEKEQQQQQEQEDEQEQESEESQEKQQQGQGQGQEGQEDEEEGEKGQHPNTAQQQHFEKKEPPLEKTQKKVEKKPEVLAEKTKTNSSQCHSSKTEISSKPTESKKEGKTQYSQLSLDDRTDTQSQMKKTEYQPAKWIKKSSVPNESQTSSDPWKRKQAIIKRILLIVK